MSGFVETYKKAEALRLLGIDMEELEQIIDVLKARRAYGIPAAPEHPMPASYGDEACSVCGINFKQMTGYVCGHSGCPRRVTCL